MKAALFVCLVVLAVPCAAVAGETPTPAVSACKAEYEQLGADRFAAKYGAGDTGVRACVTAHGGTAPTAPVASGPEAECKAEYLRIGAAAFTAKYGVEAFQACVKARGGTVTPPKPVEPVGPEALCKAEYVKLGADAFKAKYGATEPLQACIRANGGTVTPKPVQPAGPEAACKAELLKLGETAFKAKYGATEAFGTCVNAAGGEREKPAPSLAPRLCELEYKKLGAEAFATKYGTGDAGKRACLAAKAEQAAAIAAKCKSADDPEACVKRALGLKPAEGTDVVAGLAKTLCSAKLKTADKQGDGKDRFAACVKATLPKLRELVARCKTASGDDRAAFKQCLADAVKTVRARS